MRILLADNQSAVRSALRLLLEQEVGVSIVGEVAEAVALLAQAAAAQPELVLLDWGCLACSLAIFCLCCAAAAATPSWLL